jgi:hypothetical protein
MKCCADLQKNYNLPSAPAVKDDGVNQQLVAIAAPDALKFGGRILSFARIDFAAAKSIASSQPQLAVLCSFLI